MNKLALFASGSGSNVENIYKYFVGNDKVKVGLVLTDNKNAYVIERAKKLNIPYIYFNYKETSPDNVLKILASHKITHIALGGYLRLIPKTIIRQFKNKILNIHPSLLPKHGGKGYYGDYVHRSVLKENDKESGITIHLVNEEYDKGKVLFQKSISVLDEDTVSSLSSRIHELEYKFFPQIIEKYILNKL